MANGSELPVAFTMWLPVVVDDYAFETLFKVIEKTTVPVLFSNDK